MNLRHCFRHRQTDRAFCEADLLFLFASVGTTRNNMLVLSAVAANSSPCCKSSQRVVKGAVGVHWNEANHLTEEAQATPFICPRFRLVPPSAFCQLESRLYSFMALPIASVFFPISF